MKRLVLRNEGIYINSKPNKEADIERMVIVNGIFISTHSLTRRLTFLDVDHNRSEKFQLTASQGG